jgi:hypothetical protein
MPVAITESSEPGRTGKPRRFPRSSANQAQRNFNNGFAAKVRGKPRPPERSPKAIQPALENGPGPMPRTAVRFSRLSSRTCKWPIWPDMGPAPPVKSMLFCGAWPVDGSSYCEHHHARSKRP